MFQEALGKQQVQRPYSSKSLEDSWNRWEVSTMREVARSRAEADRCPHGQGLLPSDHAMT